MAESKSTTSMGTTSKGTTSKGTTAPATPAAPRKSKRKVLVGEVVSTKMQKTIVIEVTRKFSHPLYTRVMSRDKRFYAHDEKKEAHLGDVVRIEETRPLSKLKRWRLLEIVRRSSLAPEVATLPV